MKLAKDILKLARDAVSVYLGVRISLAIAGDLANAPLPAFPFAAILLGLPWWLRTDEARRRDNDAPDDGATDTEDEDDSKDGDGRGKGRDRGITFRW